MDDLEARLKGLVRGTPWLMRALATVRDVGVPDGYIGAGAIRDTVWDAILACGEVERRADVDVVYFDELDPERDWGKALARRVPDLCWEVTNQATVHRWQSEVLGWQVPAYRCVSAAIGAWPETATAVAVRLSRADELEVVAPCGLADLFEGIVRRNLATPDAHAFARRVEAKQWQRRWRDLRIIRG